MKNSTVLILFTVVSMGCDKIDAVCTLPDGSTAVGAICAADSCLHKGTFYPNGETVEVRCNTCVCVDGELTSCTEKACNGCDTADGWHAFGEEFPNADGCGHCLCSEAGVMCTEGTCTSCEDSTTALEPRRCETCTCDGDEEHCTPHDCDTCDWQGQLLAPGESVGDLHGCNTCWCTAVGMQCTTAPCYDRCIYYDQSYTVGDSFPAGDGCNLCECTDEGVVCSENDCSPCIYYGTWHQPNEEFLHIDGCNICKCSPDGTFPCTTQASCDLDVCFVLDENACANNSLCAWLQPGCSDGDPPAITEGCYPAIECSSDADCGDLSCEQVTVHPCGTHSAMGEPGGVTCQACGAQRGVCMGEPQRSNEEQLCETTGGTWDPTACGHTSCWEIPVCDAIIPGCDCGDYLRFEPGVGCTVDPACYSCADGPCPPGSVCEECTACPTCGVCKQACEPLSCDFDSHCPEGSHCVGSSVCPPDVFCIWEGEPGICLPN